MENADVNTRKMKYYRGKSAALGVFGYGVPGRVTSSPRTSGSCRSGRHRCTFSSTHRFPLYKSLWFQLLHLCQSHRRWDQTLTATWTLLLWEDTTLITYNDEQRFPWRSSSSCFRFHLGFLEAGEKVCSYEQMISSDHILTQSDLVFTFSVFILWKNSQVFQLCGRSFSEVLCVGFHVDLVII